MGGKKLTLKMGAIRLYLCGNLCLLHSHFNLCFFCHHHMRVASSPTGQSTGTLYVVLKSYLLLKDQNSLHSTRYGGLCIWKHGQLLLCNQRKKIGNSTSHSEACKLIEFQVQSLGGRSSTFLWEIKDSIKIQNPS